MLIRILTPRNLRLMVKSRIFAAAVLAVFCFAAVSMVSANGKTVRVLDGETEKSIYTLRTDPEQILSLAGIELAGEDEYVFSGFKNKTANLTIHRAVEVTVTYATDSRILNLANATVADAVKAAGYEMTEHDYLNISPETKLSSGLDILINSVDFVFITEEKALSYETKTVYSDTLEKDKVVSKAGSEGLEVLTYKQKTVNGEVVAKELVKAETVKQPVAAQKIIGTKKAAAVSTEKLLLDAVTTTASVKTISRLMPKSPIPLDAKGRPVSYKKLITGKATAYSPSDGNTTATGKAVQTGYIAVNPKIIPYGTKMYIRTPDGKYIYGYASAEDTGGFIRKGNIIADLFFNSYSEAIAFGVRNIEIYILD